MNYFYLSDGTKLSALDGSGEGLVHRGPFVYRKSSGSNAGSSLTLESAAFGGGRLTPDFTTGYTDFGARQYSPALRRWMTPDPLSEKYYGVSPYAFCNNNPVNFVDPDGEAYGKVLKVGKKIYKAAKAGKKISVKGILKSEWLDIVDNAHTIIDPDASLFEKGVAGIDLATGFGDEVKWFAKAVGVSDAVVDGTRVIDGIKFKSFTRNNFRDNLGRLTGGIPDGMQAHHTLPYKFEKKFSDIGINIHDPKYGVWLDNTLHNKLSQEYNKAWEKFFIDNPSYTAEQVMEYATKLMNDIFGQ